MNIINMIKKKGVKGIVRAVLVRTAVPLNNVLSKCLKSVPLDSNLIVFESEGDLSDNSYALYKYMINNDYVGQYKYVWLVDNINRARSRVAEDTKLIKKKPLFIDLKRAYYLAKCKYYICDHYNALADCSKKDGQYIVNLFHGCTFKGIKGNAAVTNVEDLLLVTGDFWKEIMANFVGCSVGKTVSLGFPRNDYFFEQPDCNLLNWQKMNKILDFDRVFLWMPTFRTSATLRISEDYYKGQTGLPIIEQISDLIELNDILNELNVAIIFKVHHLQQEYDAFSKKYSNILILKDEDIATINVQLYQIVSLSDALITDYSSISNDYMLLDRPMIFTLDDYEAYRSSRGFSIDDPAQFFPGHHVYNKKQLFEAISDVATGKDLYKGERNKLLPIMHKYQDGNSCKRVLDYIGL